MGGRENMRVAEFRVSGPGLEALVPTLTAVLAQRGVWGEYYVHSEDGRHILASERQYLRVKSSLLSVLLITITGNSSCHIRAVTGGGGAGLLNLSLGAEDHRTAEIEGIIEQICTDNSWELSRGKRVEISRFGRSSGA
jgi:hypothetical protein